MGHTAPALGTASEEGLTVAKTPSAAFAALVDEHRGIAFKVAHTYCWQADDRQDLVQEILAQAWRAFPSYDPARLFTTWFYRIALNVAISWVRGPGRRRQLTEPFEEARHDRAAAPNAADDERVRALYRVIRSFEPLNRALLVLYLDERPQREIAAILGLSETNVATKIGRLKLRLKQELEHRS
jgi:RNA polymerase sigma-70 factor (ECF subfamily)